VRFVAVDGGLAERVT